MPRPRLARAARLGPLLCALALVSPSPAEGAEGGDLESASESEEAEAADGEEEPASAEDAPASPAEGPGGYDRSGVYSAHHALFALSHITQDGGAPNQDTLGADFRVGYRAHPRAAAELQFEWTDRFNESQGGVTTRQFHDNWSLSLNGRLFLLTGRWQPYALVGFGALHVNEEITAGPRIGERGHDDDGVGRFGVGADLYGDEDIAINLEAVYVQGFGGLIEFAYASFAWGFLFRF
jgi:opacity protein-like surface antigen